MRRPAQILMFATGVWTGGAEDLAALGAEDLVDGVDELGAAILHARLGTGQLVAVSKEQVPAAWVVHALVGCSVILP